MIIEPWNWPQGCYVHIPFCQHRCHYCDFAVAIGQENNMALYVEALEKEIRQLTPPQRVRTLFLGGGTPSYLPEPEITRLLQFLQSWFPDVEEWSMEANPDDISVENCSLWSDLGITRLSLGVQSFQPKLLRSLDRHHDRPTIFQALATARPYFNSLSLDLMFAAPGSTLDDWQADVETALKLDIDHLSTYGLTYEKGTSLWKAHQQGLVQPLSEEDERDFFAWSIGRLHSAGWHHYEISNFARPGHECQHNQIYWANHAYFGFGVGAASYRHGVRKINLRDTEKYLRNLFNDAPVVFQTEELTQLERARETAALQLRRLEGIHLDSFHEQTGKQLDELFPSQLPFLLAEGLLQRNTRAIALSTKGIFLADAVICQLLKDSALSE